MRTKDLIDLADNPNFIAGIYNYCVRWCERCPFTARCLVSPAQEFIRPGFDEMPDDFVN